MSEGHVQLVHFLRQHCPSLPTSLLHRPPSLPTPHPPPSPCCLSHGTCGATEAAVTLYGGVPIHWQIMQYIHHLVLFFYSATVF